MRTAEEKLRDRLKVAFKKFFDDDTWGQHNTDWEWERGTPKVLVDTVFDLDALCAALAEAVTEEGKDENR